MWVGSVASVYLTVATALIVLERSSGINSPEESFSLLARSALIVGPLSILLVVPACLLCRKMSASLVVKCAVFLLNLLGTVCATAAIYWAYPIVAGNCPGIGI